MSKRRSQTERAAYAVKRRKEDYEAKRFNNPLRIFLERKYPKILEEFTELYNFFDYVNPGRKDLTKTSTFKQWMAENPVPIKNILPSTMVSANPSETETNTFLSTTVSASPSETETNTFLSTTVSASPSETETNTSVSPSEVDTLSEIIDELFGPNGIPDGNLSTSNEDEGIELNHFDELAFDIEPFDFLLETEGF